MGLWGVGTWEGDQPLDTAAEIIRHVFDRLEEASKDYYYPASEMMACVECLLGLPTLGEDHMDKLQPYIDKIKEEDAEWAEDDRDRAEYMERWYAAVETRMKQIREDPFRTTLMSKIAEKINFDGLTGENSGLVNIMPPPPKKESKDET